MQWMHVVGVINPEGRLNNRQLHHKFNACRSAQPEIRSGGNRKLLRKIGGVWKTWSTILGVLQILKACRIETQSALAKDAVGAAIKKQHGLKGVADNRDAVLDISKALPIAARETDGVSQHRQANGPLGRLTKTVQARVAGVSELLRGFDGNIRDRRDGANVKPPDDPPSAHLKPTQHSPLPTHCTAHGPSCT